MLHTLMSWLRRHPRLALGMGGALALGGLLWLSRPAAPPPPASRKPEAPARLLTPEVELRGIVRQLQEDQAAMRKTLEEAVQELKALKEKAAAPTETAPPPTVPSPKGLEGFRRELGPPPPPPVAQAPPPPAPAPRPPAAPAREVSRVSVFTIAPVTPPPPPAPPAPRWVHLPAGSFVRVTLLSGVYAPIRGTQPLPVLVHLDEAPVGPNASRTPLARCAAIARALGDFTSQRATLQLDTLSCVAPSGQAISRPLAGWVSGADGVFGIEGTLVERTGRFLSRVALAGFLSGAASAFAQAQTTTTATGIGGSQTTITGNEAIFGAASGLAQIANRMAAFYERQLEQLVPAVYVPAGVKGSAVVQTGVTLDGLPLEALAPGAEGSPWPALD